MKTLCLFVTVLTLSGCSPKSEIIDHPPITKAFGWNFGEKLATSFVTYTNSEGMSVFGYCPTNGFFDEVCVTLDDQRRICNVEAHRSMLNVDPFDLQNLVDDLSKKYGLNDKDDNKMLRRWSFGPGGEVVLLVFNGSLTLNYCDHTLWDPYARKLSDQKNQQFERSISGI